MLKRLTNGEFVLALLMGSFFWIGVLVWSTSYSPADPEKNACYQAAAKSGRSAEECKSFWEKTTSDPIAMFTLVLAFSTVGLWIATISLNRSGNNQLELAREEFNATHRPWVKVNRIEVAGDLVFEQGEARVDILVIVSNYGNSPGLRVRTDLKLVASNQINLLEEQQRFAATFRQAPGRNELRPEITSWPRDEVHFPVRAWLNSIDMARFRPLADSTPFPIILLSVVGCVTYEFSFSPGYHQTGLVYTLRKMRPYPDAYLHDEVAGAHGAVRLEGTISQTDLATGIGFEGTGPVD